MGFVFITEHTPGLLLGVGKEQAFSFSYLIVVLKTKQSRSSYDFLYSEKEYISAHVPSVLDSSKVQEDMPVYGLVWYFALRALRKYYLHIFFFPLALDGVKVRRCFSREPWGWYSGACKSCVIAVLCCVVNRHLKGGANSVHGRVTWQHLAFSPLSCSHRS